MWLFDLVGSLGLFLLGMWLMTEGLKLAGGQALRNLLGRWTSSRSRGLAAGVLVTALVQSSSAVTVATIGFVNAGLMSFQQSVWVIFGSNVGTTMTAWLVTLFGFSLNIDSFTFPLLGVGAFLRVFSPYKRGQAFGMALAGFGLLFMGINALQSTFTGLESSLNLTTLNTPGLSRVFIGLGLGLFLTLVTQSSSAAIALILTAVASGIAGLNVAAAAVIGANIGTTSTAVIASFGATANARRLALAHVAFNLITALVALLLLPLFLGLVNPLVAGTSGGGMTLFLAIFHTFFNVTGVLLMWPLEPPLSRWLMRRYQPGPTTEKASKLDKNVATIPDLALRALILELQELRNQLSATHLGNLLQTTDELAAGGETPADLDALEKRLDGVNQFIVLMSQADLSEQLSERITAGFSINHYLINAFDTLKAIAAQREKVHSLSGSVAELLQTWLDRVLQFARDLGHMDQSLQGQHWAELLGNYQQFKNAVLAAGVHRHADINSVEEVLFIGSLSKRYLDQLLQTSQPLQKLVHQETRSNPEQSQVTAVEPTDPAPAGEEPAAPQAAARVLSDKS